ncbi:MAG: YfaZ family outer membrane protein [Arsenophonus sp.]|nr:MAG: YfaZ family outer membrane protein [Arsenophonus sp.]
MIDFLHAIVLGTQIGKDFTEFSASIGNKGVYLEINGNLMRNNYDEQLLSFGGAFGVPFGPFSAYFSEKTYFLSLKDKRSLIFSVASGIGANLYIMPCFSIYSEIYGLPYVFTFNNYSYKEANIGITYEIIKSLIMSVGYRFIKIKDNSADIKHTFADNFFIGGVLHF